MRKGKKATEIVEKEKTGCLLEDRRGTGRLREGKKATEPAEKEKTGCLLENPDSRTGGRHQEV